MPFKRGAPMGNRNRRIHGLYSREMNERRAAIRRRIWVAKAVLARVAIVVLSREALAAKKLRTLPIPMPRPVPPLIYKHGQMPRFRTLELVPPPRWRQIERRF